MIYFVRHTHRSDQGDYFERLRVEKTFDPPLSKIGEFQAFSIGEKLIEEIGRKKEILFIVSPYQRCIQTTEWLYAGMIQKWTKLYNKKIFVEDAVKEIQLECCVKDQENFSKLEFFEKKKLTDLEIVHNQLEFLNGYRGINFEFPESDQAYSERLNFVLTNLQEFCVKNRNIVPIVVSHGCVTEAFYHKKHKHYPIDYNYGSVNKFVLSENNAEWIHSLYDGKYY
jgi:broad specificity phosphatase PhoE